MRRIALCAALVALSVASPAEANDWPRNLFVLHESPEGNESNRFSPVHDVAETADGRVVIATGDYLTAGASLLELAPDGRVRTLATFKGPVRLAAGGGIGIGADRGSGTLVVEGFTNRLTRVARRSTVLAGSGRYGFSGDGGPAVAARIRPVGTLGVVRTSDGSVVFTDSWNNRLRRVRPDGVIETIAGAGGSLMPLDGCSPFAGDGGPAIEATLCTPKDVLATADGALVVSDSWSRVRRIARDGTIATIAGSGEHRPATDADDGRLATEVPVSAPEGLAQAANGDILFATDGQIQRVTPEGRWHRVLEFHPDPMGGQPADSSMMDFAGRAVVEYPSGIAVTREGGLLIAARDVYYLAPARSRRMLVAIRDARIQRGRLTVEVDATRAARATIEVRTDGRTVASAKRRIDTGRQRLRVAGGFAPRPHQVRVTLRRGAARARDALPLYLGVPLTSAYANELAELLVDESPAQRCRRFTSRRIDCVFGLGRSCDGVVALKLRSTGVVWRRYYACDDLRDPFRRRPAWTSRAFPLGPRDPR